MPQSFEADQRSSILEEKGGAPTPEGSAEANAIWHPGQRPDFPPPAKEQAVYGPSRGSDGCWSEIALITELL